MAASFVGVLFTVHKLESVITKHLNLLISFSAGVCFILVGNLLKEVLEVSNVTASLWWIAGGAVGMLVLSKILPTMHHHDAPEEEVHHLDPKRIVISDALHNIGDGILLATSFMVSVPVGIAVAIGIFVHELLQEVSEFFVMKKGGYSTRAALMVNGAVSSTILIGAVGTFLLLSVFENLEIPLLALSTGAFLVVIFQDLIPESIRSSKTPQQYLQHLMFFGIGLLLMSGVSLLTPDAHQHGHGVHNDEQHEEEGHEDHGDEHEDDDHEDEEDLHHGDEDHGDESEGGEDDHHDE